MTDNKTLIGSKLCYFRSDAQVLIMPLGAIMFSKRKLKNELVDVKHFGTLGQRVSHERTLNNLKANQSNPHPLTFKLHRRPLNPLRHGLSGILNA